jgi:hypothetical protein
MNKGTGSSSGRDKSGRDKSLDKSGSSSSARRSPINIKSIGEDMRMKIIETAFKFPEEIDNKIKGEYREGR